MKKYITGLVLVLFLVVNNTAYGAYNIASKSLISLMNSHAVQVNMDSTTTMYNNYSSGSNMFSNKKDIINFTVSAGQDILVPGNVKANQKFTLSGSGLMGMGLTTNSISLEDRVIGDTVYVKFPARWMAGNFDPKAKSRVGGWWLFFRLLMIFIISYFNSEMVRVIMFRPEIVAEIKLRQDKETSAIIDSLQTQRVEVKKRLEKKEDALQKSNQNLEQLIAAYDEKITTIDDSLNYWNSKLVHEVKGPGGVSGITGDGPVSKAIRETISRYNEMKTALIAERDAAKTGSVASNSVNLSERELKDERDRAKEALAEIDTMQSKLIKQVMDRPVNGLSFMITVLNDIAKRNWLIWAVFGMFIFIESIPVLMKFFSDEDSFIHQRAKEYMQSLEQSIKEAAEIRNSYEETRRNNATNP